MGMKQPSILIVDDSLIIRKALSLQLERFGAVVSQAEDGAKGLEESLSGNFDLIITDVGMPHLDGFGLCERLKGHPNTRSIPVIILSSLESDRDIEQGFRVGAAAYVSKSEAQTQLNETIERVKEKSRFHRGRLILVVDDSLKIRQLLSQALAEEGFQVITGENGKQALMRVQDLRPDLILSDIDMPMMNVPDSILSKPGRLDAKEFAIIKEHPIIGASILGSIPSMKPLVNGDLPNLMDTRKIFPQPDLTLSNQ
jgi:putative two-component system response regulator